MFDLSFLQIVSRAIATIVVLAVMGFAVAGFARLLGDKGAGYDGKLTLNPLTHIDIVGLAAGIVARTGWIRPIAIDPAQCRGGRAGPVLAALAAMVAVWVFGRAVMLALPWIATSWPASSAAYAGATVREIANTVAWTLAINTIPVPPLLGGYLLQALAPGAHAWLVKRHLWVSLVLLVLIVLLYRSLPGTVLGNWAGVLGTR